MAEEAFTLTDYKASVSDLAWSPDSTRLALAVSDVDPDAPKIEQAKDGGKTAKPIVVARLQFKRDTEGYLQREVNRWHRKCTSTAPTRLSH